ncbi:hypothetical protein ACWAT4_21780 [Bradyrhizobium manausense]
MNLNKDPESWAKVDACAATNGSQAQSENVMKMALQDIQRLAAELRAVRDDHARICRNRDMWRSQCEQQAEQLSEKTAARLYGIIDPDYARVFTMARVLAWAEGYALLFHGSFTRDLDLVAVPWTGGACEPEHLLRRIIAAADLKIVVENDDTKHWGRKVWTLTFKTFGDPRFIDLSIMPRGDEMSATDNIAKSQRAMT